MTNTVFHALPASWALGLGRVYAPVRLTKNETAELIERTKEFWTFPGEFSVSVRNSPLGDYHVLVEYDGESRHANQIVDVLFTFYQDVNNDVIKND